MSSDYERRARQADISIRVESREVEKLRLRQQQASASLVAAQQALDEVEAAIAATESAMHKAVTAGPSLDLDALQAARHYLAERYRTRQQGQALLQRAQQKAAQADTELKQAALQVKALERVRETSQKTVLREREKRSNEQLTEQWLQHRLQHELQNEGHK
ncbi:hypothetical protein FKG94_17065 [Exilibacterium tricleocarpae]|uniref:Uncharacterized protein n=1 Tax=Exilibacterium tricleocarpae TaxID=2591008 RepID=A0A545T862_9GAMM|nr:hypothetical protein [Exilibacterium tricleocarpae]TQV73414.1 hypothetical protein FKG94_17065 [Exilibacterium tricleocarpae]